MKACPFCAEQIQDAAAKCRFCGEWLDPSKRPDGSAEVPRTTAAAVQHTEFVAPPPSAELKVASTKTVPYAAGDAPIAMGIDAPVAELEQRAAPKQPPPPPAQPAVFQPASDLPAHARAAQAPAAQPWSPPAWLATQQPDEAPARTGQTVVPPSRRAEGEPGRASLEEVALRMQRIKASAAAVRQAVQQESRRQPPHATLPAPPPASIAPAAMPAPVLRNLRDDDDDLTDAPTVVDGPRPPIDAAEIDMRSSDAELRAVPRSHVAPGNPTATSGAFDAMPAKNFEDGFLGDLDGEEDEEFGEDDDFGDEEEGDFGDAGDFGDVRASRPLPWKPILVGATLVLGLGLTVFWGRIFPSDDEEPAAASDESKGEEGEAAESDEVAKGSVAPEKAEADPVPGEGQPVVPEGEGAAVGAPQPAVAEGATPAAVPGTATPSAEGAVAGAATPGAEGVVPGTATPGTATPGVATPGTVATPGAATPGAATPGTATPAAAGAPLDPALLAQLEEARTNYRNGGKKRLKAAQGLLEQILAKTPMHPDALLVMAQVQLELGLPEESLGTATSCTQVAPEMADCWLTIGVLKQERRDTAAAAEAYARYLELAPDGAYAGQVSKQLKRLR